MAELHPMSLTVSELNIYPVKGLKGIALEEARCTERGLENDRRWMVVDAQGTFVSQRSIPRMATVWTEFYDDALALSAPDMEVLEVPLEARDGEPMRVVVWRSICDAIAV